jgi:hypothetical protein
VRRTTAAGLLAATIGLLAGCTTQASVIPVAPVAPPPTVPPNGLTFDADHVQLRLSRTADGPAVLSFGLPVPPKTLTDPAAMAVKVAGRPVQATVTALLHTHAPTGEPDGVASVLVQLPAAVLAGPTADVDVAFTGGVAAAGPRVPFRDVSVDSPAVVTTADRAIRQVGGTPALVETDRKQVTLFDGREPAVLVDYPPGYLAATGILGSQVAAGQATAGGLGGMRFVSDAVTPFGLSAMYADGYALNPDPESVVVPDPRQNYEAWLYDRCATFLSFYVHTGDTRFLRYGDRTCSSYASQIRLDGPERGYFTGKAEPDSKYSHLRGLYAYYALTGDESARAAGEAVADLWDHDPDFVAPYRDGHVRGPDKLWTERLLGVGMEGEYFGYLLTDNTAELDGFRRLLDTAYRHVSGDAAAIAAIDPGTQAFPPQNCFVHTAEQHGEGTADQPWCSGWMSELLIPTLLAYQRQTDDPRVDDIFVRLTRFLRDTGSAYLTGDVRDETFLHPSVAYDAADGDNARMLVPLYGAGIGTDGRRQSFGEYDDQQHCLDATALVAAGLRGLRREHSFDDNPVGPFASEGQSFLALEQELASCARRVFADQTRTMRDPHSWTGAALAAGLADPAAFIAQNKIGFPSHNNSPERRLSWWFNSGLLDFALLRDAGVTLDVVRPGAVQP